MTDVQTTDNGQGLVVFSPTMAEIAKWKDNYANLSAETQYEEVRLAIRQVVTARTSIDKRRLEETAKYREYTKTVNTLGGQLIAAIEEIEIPLKAKKKAVDDAAEAEARRKVAEEKARIEAEERSKREEEEARLKAIRDAENAKIAEDRKKLDEERSELERSRKAEEVERRRVLEEQRKAFEDERKAREEEDRKRRQEQEVERQRMIAQAKEAQDKIDAERRKLDEARAVVEKAEREIAERKRKEQEAKDRDEFERQAKIRAREQADREQAERTRLETERADVERKEAIRIAEMKPDEEKIHKFADEIKKLVPFAVKTKRANEFLDGVVADLGRIALKCKSFSAKG